MIDKWWISFFQDTIPSISYDYIVDQQPLGAKLFRRFCVKHKKEYYHYNEFLDAVDGYEVEQEDVRVKSAQAIVTKYLTRPATSDSGVDTCEESQGEAQGRRQRDSQNERNF
jgi:hypothetical protein